MKTGTRRTPSAARSASRALTVPPIVAPGAWLTVPSSVRTSPVTVVPASRAALPLTTTRVSVVAPASVAVPRDDDDGPDVAADPSVAADDDQRVEMVALRDGHAAG